MRVVFVLCSFIFSIQIVAQELSAKQIVENSIGFHDPKNRWSSFKDTLFLIQKSPDNSELLRTVLINRKDDIFGYQFEKKEGVIDMHLENGFAIYHWNGHKEIPEDILKKYQLTQERALLYKNYYNYLYGMPMKIFDPGSHVGPGFEKVVFHDKELLKVKVRYDPDVGKDVWYFYFDPHNFALEAYQFFHNESQNDGEYILFSGLSLVGEIRMPELRSWYTNAEGTLLGVDLIREKQHNKNK